MHSDMLQITSDQSFNVSIFESRITIKGCYCDNHAIMVCSVSPKLQHHEKATFAQLSFPTARAVTQNVEIKHRLMFGLGFFTKPVVIFASRPTLKPMFENKHANC